MSDRRSGLRLPLRPPTDRRAVRPGADCAPGSRTFPRAHFSRRSGPSKETRPMAISSRAALALSLGTVCAATLVGVTYGQQGDGAAKKSSGTGAPASSAPAPAPKPTVIATIDLEVVLRGYEKAKYQ